VSEFLQQLVNGVTGGCVYALIALGYTMVYGILRLINFAHGDVYMLGAFFGYYIARWIGVDRPGPLLPVAVLVVAMAGCGLVGFLIERLAYKPVRKSSRLAALITAIGVSLLLENAGVLVFGADPKFFPQIIPSRNLSLGAGVTISNQQVIILVVSLVLMLGLRHIVLYTRVGKAMRAVSHSHTAAALMGIPVGRRGRAGRAPESQDRAVHGHHAGPQGLRGRRARRDWQHSGRGSGRTGDGDRRGHGGRIPVADLPGRDRVRAPDPDPAGPTRWNPRPGRGREGVT